MPSSYIHSFCQMWIRISINYRNLMHKKDDRFKFKDGKIKWIVKTRQYHVVGRERYDLKHIVKELLVSVVVYDNLIHTICSQFFTRLSGRSVSRFTQEVSFRKVIRFRPQFKFLERLLIAKQWSSNNTREHRCREVLACKATLYILQPKVLN